MRRRKTDPRLWWSLSVVIIASAAYLWVFNPPKQFHSGDAERNATVTVGTVLSFSPSLDPLDAKMGSDVGQLPDSSSGSGSPVDAQTVEDITNASTPNISVLFLEPILNESTPLFLQVRKEFDSLAEADNYASDVLPAPWGDRCQVGIKGQEGRERFVLLVGPFATRRDAGQAQRALKTKKIRVLFINEDWQLRRFRSIEPLMPHDPTVSENIFALQQPAKPQGQAIFPPWPTCSQYLFCK